MTAAVDRNYSGWPTKTEGMRKAEIDRLTAQLRAKVAAGDETVFRQSMEQWLAWFDDGRLRLQWAAAPVSPPLQTRWRALDESATLARLRGETARTLEKASPEAARLLASESQRMQSAREAFLLREPA